MNDPQSTIVVCDAGPLIHLDELDSLDLLAVHERIIVPEAVWREVKRHRPRALEHAALRFKRIDVVPEPGATLQDLLAVVAVDEGEDAALRLMESYPRATLLPDDGAARLVAERMGYLFRGTLGIIVASFHDRRKSKDEVIALLTDVPQRSSLFVSRRVLHAVIAEVEGSSL